MEIGCILWEGPSRLDGAPIVALATFHSENEKTGDMVGTWILRADVAPHRAVLHGADGSVCGIGKARCPLAGRIGTDGKVSGRACYVNTVRGPLAVWNAWRAGRYPAATPELLAQHVEGRPVRIGSYGDPAAVPIAVWRDLAALASGHTAYTHQWRRYVDRGLRNVAMASVSTAADREEAKRRGWRTFRVRAATDPVLPGEIVCPASTERGFARSCATCLACDGADRPGKSDVVIIGHGSAPIRTALKSLFHRES